MGKIINTNKDVIGEELKKRQLEELVKNSVANKQYSEMIGEFIKMNKHLGSITGKEI